MSQLQLTSYVLNFGGALNTLLSTANPAVPVHYAYNPAAAKQNEFIVWAIRNVQQDVFTGSQNNKGIDRPIFGLTLFTATVARQTQIIDIITNAWHGFRGNLNGISVGKASLDVVVTIYDEDSSLYQAVLDLAMQVAVPNQVTLAVSGSRSSSPSTSSSRRI